MRQTDEALRRLQQPAQAVVGPMPIHDSQMGHNASTRRPAVLTANVEEHAPITDWSLAAVILRAVEEHSRLARDGYPPLPTEAESLANAERLANARILYAKRVAQRKWQSRDR